MMTERRNPKLKTAAQRRIAQRCIGLGAVAVLTLLAAGCRQDMQNEPKFVPQRGTTFFADHR